MLLRPIFSRGTRPGLGRRTISESDPEMLTLLLWAAPPPLVHSHWGENHLCVPCTRQKGSSPQVSLDSSSEWFAMGNLQDRHYGPILIWHPHRHLHRHLLRVPTPRLRQKGFQT